MKDLVKYFFFMGADMFFLWEKSVSLRLRETLEVKARLGATRADKAADHQSRQECGVAHAR